MERVSVIMPVFNGEKYIDEAVRSVLAQTYPNVELVIVNDGSTDATGELIRRYAREPGVKILHHEKNRGKAAAVNRGFRESQGELIVLLAADDVLPPDSLEKRVRHLGAGDAAYCNVWRCDGNLNRIEKMYKNRGEELTWRDHKVKLLWRNPIAGGAIILRRPLARKIFPIPESLKFEDWWISYFVLFHARAVKFLDEPLLLYRIHGGNDHANLGYRTICTALRKDYVRHLTFYDELKKKLISLKPEGLADFIEIIDTNRRIKQSAARQSWIPPDKTFLACYGWREYIRVQSISKNFTLPWKLKTFFGR